jgi:Icc-related predicted phosphoesterase
MKIWHISDTHNLHYQLVIPNNIDMVIHSGDFSDSRDLSINTNESLNFLEWYSKLQIPHKLLIGGNHNIALERRHIDPSLLYNKYGITYMENSSVMIDGLKIWGSPITPSFGIGWAWNIPRGKIKMVWDTIPDDTDIVVTHGPPKGKLDVVLREDGLSREGCTSLSNAIKRVGPRLHLSGHLHNNAGIFQPSGEITRYSNAAVVSNSNMSAVCNNGNILYINPRRG